MEMRLDALARKAGVPTTTVRLYQNKGLLDGPRLEGRTGYYDQSHLTRLALIARLQEQGFSLAAIGQLLQTWEAGRDLADLVGVEEQLDALLNGRRNRAVVMDAAELLGHFPPDALSPQLLQRAASMGLVEPTDDGRFRITDQRFLETGAALVKLGVPTGVVLDEWAHLSRVTDNIAKRFIRVFEDHLLPPDWKEGLDRKEADRLAGTLAQLQVTARQVVAAALDASIARQGTRRFGEVLAAAQQ
jgi:DNA-binding transcriptional MerR regulator